MPRAAGPAWNLVGRIYLLPTEAEWEYACRAGTTTAFWFGPSASSRDANFHGDQPYNVAPRGLHLGRTTAVGSYKANPWGLYDMHGNVAEFCSDYYDADYYRMGPTKDPPGAKDGPRQTARDAAYDRPEWGCRSACRGQPPIGYSAPNVGFRVVMQQTEGQR